MELNMPKVTAFLCCAQIQQDVMSKNYDLKGVFQGVHPPQYPWGVEFLTFTRFFFEEKGEFQVDITFYDDKGAKLQDNQPRKIVFNGDLPSHDLITAWRVMIPAAGTYSLKAFSNNLCLGECRLICR